MNYRVLIGISFGTLGEISLYSSSTAYWLPGLWFGLGWLAVSSLGNLDHKFNLDLIPRYAMFLILVTCSFNLAVVSAVVLFYRTALTPVLFPYAAVSLFAVGVSIARRLIDTNTSLPRSLCFVMLTGGICGTVVLIGWRSGLTFPISQWMSPFQFPLNFGLAYCLANATTVPSKMLRSDAR